MLTIKTQLKYSTQYLGAWLVKGACFLIKFYQKWLAILLPNNRCIYKPSCSTYCLGCLKKHGFSKGLTLGLFRIMRCHPFSQGGYDPVPD